MECPHCHCDPIREFHTVNCKTNDYLKSPRAPVVPRVVHCKIEPFDVYIGRPSIWGNQYSHKKGTLAGFPVETAEIAVACYERWINQPDQEWLRDKARADLRGKVLACWCKTKKNPDAPCHGDVLLRIANV